MNRQNNLPIPRRNVATTRFVLISDTYGYHPALPKGDVLCHARGLSNTGSISELRKALDWIDKADFEVKIIIAGQSWKKNGRQNKILTLIRKQGYYT